MTDRKARHNRLAERLEVRAQPAVTPGAAGAEPVEPTTNIPVIGGGPATTPAVVPPTTPAQVTPAAPASPAVPTTPIIPANTPVVTTRDPVIETFGPVPHQTTSLTPLAATSLNTVVVPTSLSSLVPIVSTSSSKSIATTAAAPVVISSSHKTTATLVEVTHSVTSASPTTATPSPSATSSSGMSTGGIVGVAAASLAGIVVVGVVVMFVIKRYFQKKEDDDDAEEFNRGDFIRNSSMIHDEFVPRGLSPNPRPPTMIERKQQHTFANLPPAPPAAYGAGYGSDMGYAGGNDSPYGAAGVGMHFGAGQPPYSEQYATSPHTAQPFFSPIAAGSPPHPGSPMSDTEFPPVQHASYDGAAGGEYFSRPARQTIIGELPNPHAEGASNVSTPDAYADLSRTSVTPFQAQQYAEIEKKLEEPADADDGASPFADPKAPAPTLPPMRALSPVALGGGEHAAFPAPPPASMRPGAKRPDTVYDEEDAYGGI